MTQSDDISSASLWTSNFGLWNSSNSEVHNGELWKGNSPENTISSLQKINGFASVAKESDKPTYAIKLPENVDILASWSPINSILPDAEKTSIWSSNDLYSSEDNLSLSASSLPWPSNTHDVNQEIGQSNTSTELWELPRNTLFFGIPELDLSESWKFEQSPFTPTSVNQQTVPISTVAVTTEAFIDSTVSTTALSISKTSENNSVKNTVCSSEDSTKTSAFSTEQLCDHLINSHDGWGKRPVDQSTPWDVPDIKPGAEQLGRSGITTPTPGSCSTSTMIGNFRIPTQPQRLESNIWTNEPPTGTGIWEMHYENNGVRSSLWPAATSSNNVPATPTTQMNPPSMLINNMRTPPQAGTVFPRPASYRNWDSNEKIWNNGGPTTSGSTGRPVLGGTRVNLSAQGQIDEPGWGSEVNSVLPGSSTFEINGNGTSWDTSFSNTGAVVAGGGGNGVQWNTAISTGGSNFSIPPFSPTNANDLRRQLPISTCSPPNNDRMLVHPFSNTYRADLVKYLMSQGFKKEDVHAALIDSNMEPERALHELRERYNPSRSFGMIDQSMKSNFHGVGGNPSQFSTNGAFSGPTGSLVNGNVPMANSNNFNRTKLMGLNVNNANGQLMPLSTHPNPQMIRQQLTQQVRSALNLSIPNPLTGGPLGNVTTPAGNSLLGQPPPPLLNASAGMHPGLVSNINQSITGSTISSFASGHSRALGSNHIAYSTNNNGPASSMHNTTVPICNQNKRQARQVAIFSAIQELQKKRRSIQQQVLMYKNNPAMSSQPQCADVFAELQGQLQQIEAQLQAKLTQLSQVCAQDSIVGSMRGPSVTTTPIDGITTSTQSRMHQDQLVQPLLEMQLKPGRLGTSSDITDNDFPTIGTWTPHTKSNTEQQDSGPKPLTGVRSGICISDSQNNSNNVNSWTGGAGLWSVNGNGSNSSTRSGLGHVPTWSSGSRPFAVAFDSNKLESQHTAQSLQGSQNNGQWLLMQANPGQGNADLTNLRTLLSQFGLTNFHLLNPFTGLVMVHLQSSELTMRLMYNLADRFTVETISEPEAIAQLQQRNIRFRSDNCTSGQFSSLGDNNNSLSTGNVQSNSKWLAAESPSGFNTVPINPRKPNNARLSVMVSGIH